MTLLGPLTAALASPPLSLNVEDLASLWTIEQLRFVCETPAAFEVYPELAVRLRGALGRRLSEQSTGPVLRSGASLPRAFDLFFAPAAPRPGQRDEPLKPLAIKCWTERQTLIVELTLFGHAIRWLDEVADGMLRALSVGIALKPEGRHRVPVHVSDVVRRRVEGVSPTVTSARLARILIQSPLVVRRRHQLHPSPFSILRAAPRVVRSLAAWQCVDLEEDWLALHRLIDRLVVDDRELLEYHFVRHSIRQRDRDIPVHAYLGRLTISGQLGRLATYLTIAETAGIGSHASLGFGSFALTLYQ